ncbi:hypothetical protein GGH16_006047, partial [Coemansia sp. RSA 560]
WFLRRLRMPLTMSRSSGPLLTTLMRRQRPRLRTALPGRARPCPVRATTARSS